MLIHGLNCPFPSQLFEYPSPSHFFGQLSSLGRISLNFLYCFVTDKRILSSALSSLCPCLCGWEQSGFVYPASCAGLAELFEPYFSARLLLLFPGNSNLVYAVIRKRNVFHQLANLPTDSQSIQKGLQRKKKTPEPISRTNSQDGVSMEGSRPAAPAEPGTLKTSLVATPGEL